MRSAARCAWYSSLRSRVHVLSELGPVVLCARETTVTSRPPPVDVGANARNPDADDVGGAPGV